MPPLGVGEARKPLLLGMAKSCGGRLRVFVTTPGFLPKRKG